MKEGQDTGAVAARRWQASPIVWLPLAALLIFLVTSLWFSFSKQVAQAEEKTLTVARAVEQHAAAAIERADIGLLSVLEHVRAQEVAHLAPAQQERLNGILAERLKQLHGVVSIHLVNADGLVVASSFGKVSSVDVSERPYFLRLKAGKAGEMVINEVIKGKLSGQWGLHVARRIDLPDGGFAGVIVANLGLRDNFESFYGTLGIGPKGLIVLMSPDNIVLVRYPVVEAALGKTLRGSAGSAAIAGRVTEKILRSVSPIDGVDRITTIRKLPDYPVYVLVGMPFQEVVRSWLKDSAALLAMSALVVLLTACTAMMAQHRFAMLRKLETLSGRLQASNQELLEANAVIEKQSLQDQLTGAWNRRFADLRLKEALAKADRDGRPFALLMFDLDHFKEINDRWGHLVGDLVLVEFVRIIQERLRISDILARWGGEEFLLLLEGSDANAAAMLAEYLRATVAAHDFATAGKLTVTIGVAQHRAGETVLELVHRVDTALYCAKNAGRNRIRVGDALPSLPD